MPYATTRVGRAREEQRGPACGALNPHGLFPVLETPQGPLFETGAIFLRLAETHGVMAPARDHPDSPSALWYDLACLMRRAALYPRDFDRGWYDPAHTPVLLRMIAALAPRPAVQTARMAEGLGATPCTAPVLATPPQGSAT